MNMNSGDRRACEGNQNDQGKLPLPGDSLRGRQVTFFGHCHCSMCRKAHGAAFATFAGIPPSVRFVHGGDLVKLYESRRQPSRVLSRLRSNAPQIGGQQDGLVPAGLFDDDFAFDRSTCSSIRKRRGKSTTIFQIQGIPNR
jgi:hypothetical protein